MLEEVTASGHKALVFSQFTSFLAILRANLDARGWNYEYLDGATQDRGARVEHFQTDANCTLFLISLKAGGFGLNLTAADYVFLLDPWWNPAVEMQAIDRVHRIGQTRSVMAYRLVARGTIEERVLELQARKRVVAESLLGADKQSPSTLSRADLELLFT
jgi:SNF2 family DNA or RNA helicase